MSISRANQNVSANTHNGTKPLPAQADVTLSVMRRRRADLDPTRADIDAHIPAV
ncbi:hypothetical protein B0G80_6962 [Paraburkholderia sp. BL6669N2]|uniref:hypothetical protein n=1 Tax=Paraburkholderia sp. BL6669N2 TaxID=1938807 RepID=UPI000E36827F|nr:hypothetical protein [Paraburkholderia sp. BL6669N2]REG50526.1 hypothetical protein B0G80_6962 [Paraburkholderia sp. BL6669N2]